MKLLQFVKKFNREESGQDLVEYALVLVAVGGAVFAGSTTLATDLGTVTAGIGTKLTSWGF